MKRIFIIGDIHGCSRTFKSLLFNTLKVTKSDDIYLLGDYIDRGPSSKKVINRILKMQKQGYQLFPIKGNHELLLINSADYVQNHIAWFKNGAKATLKSFGIKYAYEFKKKYLDFFRSLPYYYELDNYIIVHGGMNFNIENPFDDTDAMVWERSSFVDLKKTNGKRLICGHTPYPLDLIKQSLNENKIVLDGGCVYYGTHPALGYLVALELNSMELFYHRNIENDF